MEASFVMFKRREPRERNRAQTRRSRSPHSRPRHDMAVATSRSTRPSPTRDANARSSPRRSSLSAVVARRRGRDTATHAAESSSSSSSSSSSVEATTSRDLSTERAGPSTPAPTYSTSPVDRALRTVFARNMARELGLDESTPSGEFSEVRDMCLRLVRESSSAEATRERGLRILRSCAPGWFPRAFAGFLGVFPRWFAARHAAAVTPLLLPWLVGDAEVNDAPDDVVLDDPEGVPASVFAAVTGAAKEKAGYKQGVLLKRCRVLEEAGCAAVCANVCKIPTQKFFTEEVGLPVTLSPNYETFECQFTYGATPPAIEDDEAFKTPCFRQCPASSTMKASSCGKTLDDSRSEED